MFKQIQLTWTAGHEQVDDALGFCSKMRRLWCQRIDRLRTLSGVNFAITQQRSQSHLSQADSTLAKEMTAGCFQQFALNQVHGSLYLTLPMKYRNPRDKLPTAEIKLLARNEFVQVQQRAGRRSPGGPLSDIYSGWDVRSSHL